MSNPGNYIPADLRVPLGNLSAVKRSMDSVHDLLSQSLSSNTLLPQRHMDSISADISSAIHQIIVNAAAILSSSSSSSSQPASLPLRLPPAAAAPKTEEKEMEEEEEEEEEIVEVDAVELLAEHVHFCEICGKGFKRDANLRMHMRAHGDQFKTPEALAKPPSPGEKSEQIRGDLLKTTTTTKRFSCPYDGCNRNKRHAKFRPLKSVICVRNHFKRSHCPKMYACNRCNKKSFSVAADLRSHLKHCGEARWKCSCGTTFSRKDKLFGHMALFEGHMPAVSAADQEDGEEKGKETAVEEDLEEEEEEMMDVGGAGGLGYFEGLLDGFGSIEGYDLQDMLGSPVDGIGDFCGFGQMRRDC